MIAWLPRTRVDETLDVLAAHGIAGFFGMLWIGLFAQADWNGMADGLAYGNRAALGPGAGHSRRPGLRVRHDLWAAQADRHLMPLRASEQEEAVGMDVIQHGEEAYVSGEGAILVSTEDARRRRGASGRPGLAPPNCIKLSICWIR